MRATNLAQEMPTVRACAVGGPFAQLAAGEGVEERPPTNAGPDVNGGKMRLPPRSAHDRPPLLSPRERDRHPEARALGAAGQRDRSAMRAEQLKASVSLRGDPLAELAKKRAAPIFADFVRERYLPHVQERLRSAGNIEAYLPKRIVPALGRKSLDEIGQDDIASLRRGLIDEGLSPSSVNRHLATVRSMFNLALRWQLFEGRNPAASP